MKPETDTVDFPLSEASSVPDAGTESLSLGSRFLNWLAHFVLYLGAVSVVCATGFYFLLQIPALRDPIQWFESQDSPSYRPLGSIMESPAKSLPTQTDHLQPLANPANAPSSEDLAAAPSSATASSETESDPNAPPQVVEQPDNLPDDQSEVADTTPEEKPPEEPTPATPEAQIAQLLADAQQQMASRRFTAPASSNALSTYQRVLELEPGNPAALQGIDNIAAYYRDVAQQSLRQGRPDESLAYISRGLRAMPQNANLLNLRQQARRVQQQREQAQLEEMRRQQMEQELAEQRYQEQLRQQQQRAQESQAPWWQQPPGSNNSIGGFNQR
jgi:tetratricopeptide (TPR) repeat protein